jgi:hypothetical protein
MWLPPPHHVSLPKTSNYVIHPPNPNWDTPIFLKNSAHTNENRNPRYIGLPWMLGMIMEEIEACATTPRFSAKNI